MAEPATPTPAGGADAAEPQPEVGPEAEAAAEAEATPTPETPTTATAPLPTAAEYARHGIAVEALEALLDEVGADATTSDVCHAVVKPATTPAGWVDEPTLVDAARHLYAHRYRRADAADAEGADAGAEGGAPRSATMPTTASPPSGTRSYCELLLARPATAHLVGAPTLFLSHAWLYRFAEVVAALRAFVDALPRGAPPQFVWFDCFSIDEHATQALPQDWWATTFGEAIARIGHTVMVLAPWDAPTPLTRAWCLWELHCTARAPGARFSVALGPAQRRAFEGALLQDDMALLDAFARIDVRNAQAGDPRDRAMILGAVEAAGGAAALNALALGELRGWALGEARALAARPGATLDAKGQVGILLSRFQCNAEAEALLREVVAGRTAQSGGADVQTLGSKGNLAILLKHQGTAASTAEAEALYREVVAGYTAHYGASHANTLQSKGNLAILLDEQGTAASTAEAEALYREVVAGRTAHYGASQAQTLTSKLNLALLLKDQGTAASRAEAEALLREVVAGHTAHFGADHSRTLHARRQLARLLDAPAPTAEEGVPPRR